MAMAVEIRAPAEQTEGTRSQVLRWLKSVGETVAENEPLIEIETDKVTVEVASPGAGVLREIVKGEQEEIAPGELLGRIEAEGGVSGDVAATEVLTGVGAARVAAGADGAIAAAAGLEPDAVRLVGGDSGGIPGAYGDAIFQRAGVGAGPMSGVDADGADAGRVDAGGVGTGGVGGSVRVGRFGAAASDGLGAGNAAVGGAAGVVSAGGRAPWGLGNDDLPRQTARDVRDTSAAARLSPAVRRLLSENGLDPAALRGTGLGGRITVEDVLAAVVRGKADGARASAAPAAGAASRAATVGSAVADVAGGSRRIPHTPVRKRIAEHMVQSLLHTAPHVTTVFEVDMTAVLAHRLEHRDEFAKRGVPLTLTAYFLQAIVDAIRGVPEANSRWTDSALEVFEAIHIGVATALEEGGGLVVPVLRDVQSRDLFATAEGLNDLVTRAREGRLAPADVRGGTFTISNHGVSGSLLATPIIINQPQAAILGVGKLEKRAVVVEEDGEDRLVIQPRCYVTLTIDHRVMDGHQANRFLKTFVDRLTRWS